MKFSELLKDSSKEEWFDFDKEGNISFKIAPLDNDKYAVAFDKYRRHIMNQDNSNLDLDVKDGEMSEAQVQCYLFAHYVLKDWKGITDENGEAMPFNPDMAYQLLKGNTDVFLFLFEKANESTVAAQKSKEEIAKKSKKS